MAGGGVYRGSVDPHSEFEFTFIHLSESEKGIGNVGKCGEFL